MVDKWNEWVGPMNDDELGVYMFTTQGEEFGHGADVRYKLRPVVVRLKTGDSKQEYRCGYANLSKCPWSALVHSLDGVHHVAKSKCKHSDHKKMCRSTGVSGEVRAVLTPSKITLKPQTMVTKVSKELGRALTRAEIRQMISLRKRVLAGQGNGMSKEELVQLGTFGGVQQAVNKCTLHLLFRLFLLLSFV